MTNKIKTFTATVSETVKTSDFTGRRIEWNEIQDGEMVLESDTVFFHRSSDKIKKFAPIAICLHSELPWATKEEIVNQDILKDAEHVGNLEYVYRITLPKGTVLPMYEEEVRTILEPGQKLEMFAVVESYKKRKELYNPKMSSIFKILTIL
jgi:hypothetical protein